MAKRFYKAVTVSEADDGFHVLLDGRALKTPGKVALALPRKSLADLVAKEWDAQEGEIDPTVMPVTRLMNVAREQVPKTRPDLIGEARRYAGSDLLCYRAPQPADLTARQEELWSPWLDWAAAKGVALDTAIGITAITQPEASLNAVRDYAVGLDDISLTIFLHLVATFGSAILAMAVIEGALSIEAGFELSRLDEAYQIEIWGEDEEAKIRTKNIRTELIALGAILPALGELDD